jgi:hypothetical protein
MIRTEQRFAAVTRVRAAACAAFGLALALAAVEAGCTSGCRRDCSPPCRSGFICVEGECRSACNPPCPADKICRGGECFVDDTMPVPDVVVNVPLTLDSGVKPVPPPPPPPVSVGLPEFLCLGEEADGYHKCGSKPGEGMVARFVEKELGPLGECVADLVKRKPGAVGMLSWRGEFDLAAGGGAEAISVPDDTVGDDTFKKCVLKSARKVYAPDCCDYYLKLTVPVYVNMLPPEPPGGATAAPGGSAAPASASTGSGGPAAVPASALPSTGFLPASAAPPAR